MFGTMAATNNYSCYWFILEVFQIDLFDWIFDSHVQGGQIANKFIIST